MRKINKRDKAFIRFLDLLSRVLAKIPFFKKAANSIFDIKTNAVINTLKKVQEKDQFFYDFFYTNDTISSDAKNIIWVFWLQGFDKAPHLIKKCVESIIEYNGDACEVKIIDFNSYNDYVKLPPFIVDMANKGIISYAHFSDLLRLKLLIEHGGIWIDSTFFFQNSLPDEFLINDFYSLSSNHHDVISVTKGKWSINLLKSYPQHEVLSKIYNLLVNYIEVNNSVIDYFHTDYLFQLFYVSNACFRSEIDSIKKFGDHRHLMLKKMFSEIDSDFIKLINNDPVKIYKLTYKFSQSEADKDKTIYSHYLKK